ncbi:MAG: RNA pseudouridine synthase [Spirochaetaceae bacterium]|jgi:23S rRNA pseudouridine1911/1915/1917 synthase|nr:RNA pseudouridine synthase [Spirochaetaceae bacterium]
MKTEPYIVKETDSYVAAYKPQQMHTVPLKETDNTLLAWCATKSPKILSVCGGKDIEGGTIHRLDYETNGLVLFAKTQHAFDSIKKQQNENRFIKTYCALCRKNFTIPSDFPPLPEEFKISNIVPLTKSLTLNIYSAFRHYGPGSKAVRPVLVTGRDNSPQHAVYKKILFDRGKPYKTFIKDIQTDDKAGESIIKFTVQLYRGFRHQIRCHLAWIGYSILNDTLYGSNWTNDYFGLTANKLSFYDPETNEPANIVL